MDVPQLFASMLDHVCSSRKFTNVEYVPTSGRQDVRDDIFGFRCGCGEEFVTTRREIHEVPTLIPYLIGRPARVRTADWLSTDVENARSVLTAKDYYCKGGLYVDNALVGRCNEPSTIFCRCLDGTLAHGCQRCFGDEEIFKIDSALIGSVRITRPLTPPLETFFPGIFEAMR